MGYPKQKSGKVSPLNMWSMKSGIGAGVGGGSKIYSMTMKNSSRIIGGER
jgi:hypothetical protein